MAIGNSILKLFQRSKGDGVDPNQPVPIQAVMPAERVAAILEVITASETTSVVIFRTEGGASVALEIANGTLLRVRQAVPTPVEKVAKLVAAKRSDNKYESDRQRKAIALVLSEFAARDGALEVQQLESNDSPTKEKGFAAKELRALCLSLVSGAKREAVDAPIVPDEVPDAKPEAPVRRVKASGPKATVRVVKPVAKPNAPVAAAVISLDPGNENAAPVGTNGKPQTKVAAAKPNAQMAEARDVEAPPAVAKPEKQQVEPTVAAGANEDANGRIEKSDQTEENAPETAAPTDERPVVPEVKVDREKAAENFLESCKSFAIESISAKINGLLLQVKPASQHEKWEEISEGLASDLEIWRDKVGKRIGEDQLVILKSRSIESEAICILTTGHDLAAVVVRGSDCARAISAGRRVMGWEGAI